MYSFPDLHIYECVTLISYSIVFFLAMHQSEAVLALVCVAYPQTMSPSWPLAQTLCKI